MRPQMAALAFGVALVGVALQFFLLPNDDATWLIAVVRRLSAGGSLYSKDLVEINPPLIIWMTAVAMRVGEFIHVDSVTAWRLFVGAQVLVSTGLSARLLPASLASPVDLRPYLLVFLAWVYACLPAYNYGQREHFIVLWLTPYILAAAQRALDRSRPPSHEMIAGLLLGATLCLKPHYLLAALLVEGGVLLSRRSLRAIIGPTALTAAATLLLYAVVLVWRYPALFTFAAPLARHYYPAYGVLQIRAVHVWYLGTALAAALLTRRPAPAAVTCRLFVLAGTGAFLAFVLQGKGWPYHFLPAKSFFGAAIVVALLSGLSAIVERWPTVTLTLRRRPGVAAIGAVLVAGVATLSSVHDVQNFYQTRNARVVQNVAQYLNAIDLGGAPRRFAALSPSLFPAFPVNELIRGEWSSRFSCMWLLSGIVEAERAGVQPPPIGSQPGRAWLEDAMSEDFERWRPELVLVETSRQQPVLAELLKSERFQAIWSQYRVVGDVEYFRVYQRIHTPVARSTFQ